MGVGFRSFAARASLGGALVALISSWVGGYDGASIVIIGGGSGVVGTGYAVGDRRIKVTGAVTSNFGNFGGLPFSNILGAGSLHWAPAATINPLTSAYIMEFSFSESVNLQYFDWQIGLTHQWGIWTVAIKRGSTHTDMAASVVLGGSQNTGFAIDAALQAGADGIRFTGLAGLVSGSPFVENARFLVTE